LIDLIIIETFGCLINAAPMMPQYSPIQNLKMQQKKKYLILQFSYTNVKDF